MNKIQRLILLIVLVLCAFSTVQAQNKKLVIYTWEDMFPKEIFDSFKQANPGLEIVYETFDYNENMFLDLQSTGGSNYDLVIADDYIIQLIIANGLAQKLNKSKLGNIGNINPLYQHQFYDPNDEYTIPFGAGVQTIVYDPAKIKLNIKGYKDLWDKSLKNSVGIIGNYRVINGMALKTLGKSYNTEVIADIKAAGDRLKALAPNISVIEDTSLDEYLVSGKISAAVMYNDQAVRALQKKPGLKKVFPAEGYGFGIMGAFIPANAPNADAALRFLNYILDPKRGADCFEYLGYYCTFKASEQHIKNASREYLIMPSAMRRFEMIENFTAQAAEDAHSQIWKEFTSLVPNK